MSLLEFYGNTINDHAYFFPGSVDGGYAHRSGAAYGVPWSISNSASYFRLFPFGGKAHVFHGIAWTASAWDSWISFYGDGGGTVHLTVRMTASSITLYRGANASTQIAQYLIPLVAGQWYYVEVEATISDTVGVAKVRVNGLEVISFTGDTKNAGTGTTIDGVLYQHNGNLVTTFCDYYLCDDAGSAPHNTYLGDIRVTKHRPSGNGASAQFTPDTGANYSRVNEYPVSAANNVASSTSGHKDSYAMDDLPNNVGTVLAVKAGLFAKNPDGGSPAIKNLIRTAGVDYLGAAYNLGGSDLPFTHTWVTNPNTAAAWTAAEVNALESGFSRV